ncbi:hypothetical protein SAMN05192553_101611 [Cyclobacterium xiamenense]|uniref:Uncharacterized protein n=1 Tax=Cyclobacterium xiamenense TaxID=1297121 RepID=A0A1H6UAX0_9BACT|nr:hypothetical protein SAMN05192553_101611 [Cyclobacterium xiamenense]
MNVTSGNVCKNTFSEKGYTIDFYPFIVSLYAVGAGWFLYP